MDDYASPFKGYLVMGIIGFDEPRAPEFYTMSLCALAHNPVDATTYFFSQAAAVPSASPLNYILKFMSSGHIAAVLIGSIVGGAGSAETGAVYLRINDTTDYVIEAAASWAASSMWQTTESIPVSAGDTANIKVVYPTFATNPTAVLYYGGVWMGP